MRRSTLQKSALPILLCLVLSGCFKSSEERAAEHYESGLALVEQGDPDRAIVEFRNTLKYDRTRTEARRQIAEIMLRKGKKKQAYRNYLGVVEYLPEDLPARTALSELAFQLGDWSQFERHATVALEQSGSDTSPEVAARTQALDIALRYRAAVIDEDSPTQAAIEIEAADLQQAQPENGIIRRILINAYVSEGRYNEALTQVDAAIAAEPGLLENYSSRIELLARQNDLDALEAELLRVIELFPNEANFRTTLLRFYTSRKQPEKAQAFLRKQVGEAAPEKWNDAFGLLIGYLLQTTGPEAALAEVEGVLADRPDNALRLMQASLKFDIGQTEEALSEISALLDNDDSNTLDDEVRKNAQVLMARMLMTTGNEVGARKLVEDVLTADETVVEALKMRAQWQIEDDDTDGAITSLRTALNGAPQDADAMTLMARAYERAGQPNLMMDFLSLAVESTNNAPAQSIRHARALMARDKNLQAETVLISSLRIAPGNVDVLSLLGQIYLALEDNGRAKQVVATLREIDNPTARNNAEALNLEIVAREQGTDEALRILQELGESDGNNNGRAKLQLIQAQIANGDAQTALTSAEALVAESPDNQTYRYALALTNIALKKTDVARTQLSEIAAQSPNAVQVWLQLARLTASTSTPDDALAVITDGLAANPGAPDLLWAQASVMQAQSDIEGAIGVFDALYEQNSSSLIVANNLASLLATYRKDDPESVQRATRIARRLIDTKVPAFQDTYGWIAHLDGRSEEAATYLEPAAASLPQDAAVQVHLGLVYAALGRRDDAIAQLQKGLAVGGPLGGNEALLAEATAKIAELQAAPQEPQE